MKKGDVKMKKIKNNAFTLVELLVVIAILAVLATVAMLGYSSFIKKANISNDNTVVAELNRFTKAYLTSGGKVETVTDIANVLDNDGFRLSTIKTSYKKEYYAFNIETKEFLLVDKFESTYDILNNPIFVLVKDNNTRVLAETAGYSAYLQSGFDEKELETKTGVDVGVNNINSISYVGNGSTAQNIVIRTNGGTLNIGSEGNVAK